MRELAICESAIALLELVADSSASASAFALAILALALALLPFALSSVVTTLLHALLLSPTAILATLGRVGKALVIPELLIPSRVEEVLRTIRAIDGDVFPLLFLRRRSLSLLLGCRLLRLLDLLLFLFFLRDLLLLCLLLLLGLNLLLLGSLVGLLLLLPFKVLTNSLIRSGVVGGMDDDDHFRDHRRGRRIVPQAVFRSTPHDGMIARTEKHILVVHLENERTLLAF
mmetsp:Transcript_69732/g.199844  ORF Transcript_69732/g.199844 Transcript_69732/m.199844 type:complete len:228 (+) Transcript_69732:366-1049(+)